MQRALHYLTSSRRTDCQGQCTRELGLDDAGTQPRGVCTADWPKCSPTSADRPGHQGCLHQLWCTFMPELMTGQALWSRDVCTLIPSDQGCLLCRLGAPLTTLEVQDWMTRRLEHGRLSLCICNRLSNQLGPRETMQLIRQSGLGASIL